MVSYSRAKFTLADNKESVLRIAHTQWSLGKSHTFLGDKGSTSHIDRNKVRILIGGHPTFFSLSLLFILVNTYKLARSLFSLSNSVAFIR